jgi:hypothetical protein
MLKHMMCTATGLVGKWSVIMMFFVSMCLLTFIREGDNRVHWSTRTNSLLHQGSTLFTGGKQFPVEER